MFRNTNLLEVPVLLPRHTKGRHEVAVSDKESSLNMRVCHSIEANPVLHSTRIVGAQAV